MQIILNFYQIYVCGNKLRAVINVLFKTVEK